MTLRPANYAEALQRVQNRPKKPRTPLRSRSLLKASHKLKAPKRKVRRKKVPSRKSLIRKIDRLVFQIICLMYPACVECGSKTKPTTGHVLSRRSFATRWDFRNVFRQCWPHNYRAAMTAAASYHLWYVKEFGVDAFDQLYRDWAKGRKYTRLELQNLVPEFEAKLASLTEI